MSSMRSVEKEYGFDMNGTFRKLIFVTIILFSFLNFLLNLISY